MRILCSIGLGLAASFTFAADIYVATNGSDSTGNGSPGNPYASITNAIANTIANDTIHVGAGTYTHSPTVDKILTIEGAGKDSTIVQAAAARGIASARVFTISTNCTLRGMTIRYGCLTNSATYGGGIALLNNGAFDVTLEECRIAENDVKGSTTSPNYGGAISGSGASATGLLKLVSCIVVSNTAVANGTAGIATYSKAVYLSNCTVAANVSLWKGGGIYVQSGALEIYDTTVKDNNAGGGDGGGVFAGGSLVMRRCTLDNNVSSARGGGLFIGNPALVVNSTIYSNTSSSLGGGGVGIGSAGVGGTQAFYNCTIAFNYTTADGGGLRRPAGILELFSCIIASNRADGIGVDLSGGAPNVCTNCLVGDNTGSTGVPAGTPNASGSYVGTGASPINPYLLPLTNNGGATWTCAFSTNSYAFNKGTNLLALLYDQRGAPYARVVGAGCDIGAFEWTSPAGQGGTLFNFE